jgi:hypothetical protein
MGWIGLDWAGLNYMGKAILVMVRTGWRVGTTCKKGSTRSKAEAPTNPLVYL